MEIDEHKLFVAPLHRQIRHQQTALQICRTQRPGKRAGQRNPFCLFDVIRGYCLQTGIDLSEGRPGERHKRAGIVEGKGVLRESDPVTKVNMVGTGGIEV